MHDGVAQSTIVTPEGVVLDFAMAGVASRLLARLIDSIMLLFVFYTLMIVMVVVSASNPTLALILAIVIGFALVFVYPMVIESRWNGRTVGKYAMGLRVVTTEGGPVRLSHTAIRSMLQLIDILVTAGGAAVVAAISSEHGQRLGDMAAGTYVINERRSMDQIADHEVVIPTPWGLQSVVDSIDTTALDASQGALIRSVLLRAPDLSADARAALATDLATRVAAVLGTEIPSTVHPETWLACVAARAQQLADPATASSLAPPPPPPTGPYTRFVGRPDP